MGGLWFYFLWLPPASDREGNEDELGEGGSSLQAATPNSISAQRLGERRKIGWFEVTQRLGWILPAVGYPGLSLSTQVNSSTFIHTIS